MFSAEAANNDTLHSIFFYFFISFFYLTWNQKLWATICRNMKYFWLAGCGQWRGELPALLVDLNLSNNNNNGMWRVLIWQQSTTMGWTLVLNSQKFLYIYTNEVQSDLKTDWKTHRWFWTCLRTISNNAMMIVFKLLALIVYIILSHPVILDSKTSWLLDSAISLLRFLWQDVKRQGWYNVVDIEFSENKAIYA